MNILIINGSPRKKGLIAQMLGIMREEAEKHGDKVEMVYTNDLSVKPCTGCMARCAFSSVPAPHHGRSTSG